MKSGAAGGAAAPGAGLRPRSARICALVRLTPWCDAFAAAATGPSVLVSASSTVRLAQKGAKSALSEATLSLDEALAGLRGVLGMVDGVLLLVDAAEGPKPQTRFVLKKAPRDGER